MSLVSLNQDQLYLFSGSGKCLVERVFGGGNGYGGENPHSDDIRDIMVCRTYIDNVCHQLWQKHFPDLLHDHQKEPAQDPDDLRQAPGLLPDCSCGKAGSIPGGGGGSIEKAGKSGI